LHFQVLHFQRTYRRFPLRLMHASLAVSSYCVNITHFCSKPVQAAKETAGDGSAKNQRD